MANSGYPEQSGYYSWAELRALATSLGLPCSLLVDCIPSATVSREPGISTKALLGLLDMGYFTAPLNFTFCMKSGIYNVKVLAKCLDLLDSRSISFNEIQEANLAFSAYEHLDQKGVEVDRHTLTRALKLCGMAISPPKLSEFLMQSKSIRAEPGRIQLYEFLDLLVLCEPRDSIYISEDRVSSTAKTSREVYELDDMRSLLVTQDEKIALQLSQRFQQDEKWIFPIEREELRSPAFLKEDMRRSLTEARKGHPPQSGIVRSTRTTTNESQEKWTLVTPVPHLTCRCYTPKKMTPILSAEDLEATQEKKDDLRYQMATLAERSAWELAWKLDYYLPGYRERAASRPKAATIAEPQQPIRRKLKCPDVFERLSAPRRRFPSPLHAAACDAFKMGIAARRGGEAPLKTRDRP